MYISTRSLHQGCTCLGQSHMSHGALFDEDTQCQRCRNVLYSPKITYSGIKLSSLLLFSNKQRRRGVA